MTRRLTTLALLALVPVVAAGCGGPAEEGSSAGASEGGGAQLSLVAYSTPKEAYEELIPAFQKTPAGKGVSFDQSYGASGDQSRAVASRPRRPTSSRSRSRPTSTSSSSPASSTRTGPRTSTTAS